MPGEMTLISAKVSKKLDALPPPPATQQTPPPHVLNFLFFSTNKTRDDTLRPLRWPEHMSLSFI